MKDQEALIIIHILIYIIIQVTLSIYTVEYKGKMDF